MVLSNLYKKEERWCKDQIQIIHHLNQSSSVLLLYFHYLPAGAQIDLRMLRLTSNSGVQNGISKTFKLVLHFHYSTEWSKCTVSKHNACVTPYKLYTITSYHIPSWQCISNGHKYNCHLL